jgi:hypothetical protein
MNTEHVAMNNLLGRSSSDNRAVNFMPWETLHAKVEQGTVIGLLGDLAIVSSVNHLTDTIEESNRAATAARRIADYEMGNTIIANSKARTHANWLASQHVIGRTPPLEQQPGESDEVFDLKAQARAEWLSEFSRE